MHLTLSAGSVLVPVAYAVVFVLLLAPGYAAARAIVRRFGFERPATLAIAYAVVAVAGYVVFWCYFLKPELGRLVSLGWIVVGFVALFVLWRERIPREEAIPLALTFAVGLFYLAVLYLPGTTIGAAQRFFVIRPQDNIIAQQFAEHLFQGADLRHFLGDWTSSDRPPLQTAMLLLVRPVFSFLRVDVGIGYEIAGAVAQLAWLSAVWILCARAGFSAVQRALVVAFMVFSGFFLYNSVYVWPKLLAAGLCIDALSFAIAPPRLHRDAGLVLAGICAALALLAHGSAVFFLAPAFVLAVASRRLPLERGLALAALAGVVLLVPWAAYQRYYDPPGDRLLKIHLAGINAVDPRPAAAAIEQTYAQTPPAHIVRNKLANVQTVLGGMPLLDSATEGEPATGIDRWRLYEREQVLYALGVLNAGWLVFPWWWFTESRRAARPVDGVPSEARRSIGALVALAVTSTAVWCLVLWGPGTTVTTHSAYAVEALVFVALAAAIAEVSVRLACVVLALAVVDLAVTWIAGSLGDAWRVSPSIDPAMAVVALLAAAAAGALLVLGARTDEPAPGAVAAG